MSRARTNADQARTESLSVVPPTMTSAQTAYRAALRNLPATASPKLDSDGKLTNVTWPTKP
jgi:hypothetical protein